MNCSCCGSPLLGKPVDSHFIELPICADCRFRELLFMDHIADQVKPEREERISQYVSGWASPFLKEGEAVG